MHSTDKRCGKGINCPGYETRREFQESIDGWRFVVSRCVACDIYPSDEEAGAAWLGSRVSLWFAEAARVGGDCSLAVMADDFVEAADVLPGAAGIVAEALGCTLSLLSEELKR